MEKIVIIPDVHLPYHDPVALGVARNAISEFEPDTLVFLGDVVDFYSVSAHNRDPRRFTRLEDELGLANQELDAFEALAVPRVFFCAGNHENRLSRYLMTKAPELFGLVNTEQLLRIADRGWEFVPYLRAAKIGKLYVTHCISPSRTGKTALAQTLASFGANLAMGHIHRQQTLVQRTLRGEEHIGICPGWLGSFESVDYMHRLDMTGWSHGIAYGYIDELGNALIHNAPIINGAVVVNGRKVK